MKNIVHPLERSASIKVTVLNSVLSVKGRLENRARNSTCLKWEDWTIQVMCMVAHLGKSTGVISGATAVTYFDHDTSGDDQPENTVQDKILRELKRVSTRFNAGEDRMDNPSSSQASSSAWTLS